MFIFFYINKVVIETLLYILREYLTEIQNI